MSLVYDAAETYVYMRQTWIDFFAGKITIEHVCEEYDKAGVDVIVDGPGNYFWREMAEYWPKAKIILTVRDNEDKVSFTRGLRMCLLCLKKRISSVVRKYASILSWHNQVGWSPCLSWKTQSLWILN